MIFFVEKKGNFLFYARTRLGLCVCSIFTYIQPLEIECKNCEKRVLRRNLIIIFTKEIKFRLL